MTTDNRTNEPTPEQVEAAAKALRDDKANRTDTYRVPEWEDTPYGDKLVYRGQARAALVAAQGAAPQDSGKCGGCRDLGPHRNVPGCQYYEPPVLPSGGVDEDKLVQRIYDELMTDDAVAEVWSNGKVLATARRLVKFAVQGGEIRGE